MAKPTRRVRIPAAPGVDPHPAGGAPFVDDAELRTESPSGVSASEERGVELDDDSVEVVDDHASLDNTSRLEVDRPPHYA